MDLAEWGIRGEEVSAGSVVVRPQRFLEEAREQMARWAKVRLTKASADSLPRLFAVQKDPSRLDDAQELRALLLDFIADFADWGNAADPDYLGVARALTQAGHEALGGEMGTKPMVVDPFAGGGSIPIEALRIGADAFASDLNPVAVLLNRVALEYIPRFGQKLADEVRKWGQWVRDEVESELAGFYPKDTDGATPLAYLWARTVLSEAPGEDTPVEVPLIRSLWLCRKPNRKRALRWLRDDDGLVQTETIQVVYADGVGRTVQRPLLEIFEPIRESEVEAGTVAKGSATCPVTAHTLPVQRVREQLRSRGGGARDARLTAVVVSRSDMPGRSYRLPTRSDYDAVRLAQVSDSARTRADACASLRAFDAPIPTTELRRISVPLYGIESWGQFFTSRQLASSTALATKIRDIPQRFHDDSQGANVRDEAELAAAVQACLALALDKQADLGNSLCAWEPIAECPRHLFGRQAIGMVWDFAEGVATGESSGSWSVQIDRMAHILETIGHDWLAGHAQRADAAAQVLPNDSADALITDPPYYDAVPYAHLSDFFYVWLRYMLEPTHAGLFDEDFAPKEQEIVVDRPHHLSRSQKNHEYYEEALAGALRESRRVVRPDGVGLVVFASKSTSSWEAVMNAVIESGWIITGSWPVDTEMETRIAAQGQARLASSIHLACRPRENADGSLREEVGEWREILAELPVRIRSWMPRLAAEGVVGADAIFACLGPALEVFSRYSRVEKSSGEVVGLRQYLEQVWAAVSQEALSMIFDDSETAGLEPDARLTAMWLWTLSAGESPSEPAAATGGDDLDDAEPIGGLSSRMGSYTLEFDAARKIAQGLGIHLEKTPSVVEVKADKARLLSVAERTRYLFGKDVAGGEPPKKPKKAAQMDLFAELQEIDAGMASPTPEIAAPEVGTTVLDRVHQAMILFGAGRGEALKRFLVEDGIGKQANFWKLAQALSALYPTGSDEKRWVDGVLARKKGVGL